MREEGERGGMRVLSQHSPLASLHIDTNQSAGKPTYLPINPPLQPTEKFFFSARSALLYALIQVQLEFHRSFNCRFAKLLSLTAHNIIRVFEYFYQIHTETTHHEHSCNSYILFPIFLYFAIFFEHF